MAGNEQEMRSTPALRALVESELEHEVVLSERARSIEEAAARRGVPIAALLKTLVVRRGEGDYLFMLVPGDRVIDWAKLRSHLGVRRMSLADAQEAFDVTGYERGTITPFGATTAWPVIADASIAPNSMISLGGGAHGISVKMSARAMIDALSADVADVTKVSGPGPIGEQDP